MKFAFGQNFNPMGQSASDLPGFAKCSRFIVFSQVSSNTIPDILDMVFNISPGGTNFIGGDEKKTKVTVINNSIVNGDAHGRMDTRTRNVYMHYGYIDEDMDRITGESPIIFTDMDWNVIVDKPFGIEGKTSTDINQVNISYDAEHFGGELYRDTKTYNKILIPSPDFYDEKDMLMLGNKEENYYEKLQDNKQEMYFTSYDRYFNNLFKCKVNDLIDKNTKMAKLKINIENLTSNFDEPTDDFNRFIEDICCECKYILEFCGFSSGEIIFGGIDGYNIDKVKTNLGLDNFETRLNMLMLNEKLSELNENLLGDENRFTILMNFNYCNVNVRIIDKVPLIGICKNTKTDELPCELGSKLKNEISLREQCY